MMTGEHEPSEGLNHTITVKKERNDYINSIQADGMNRMCK